MEECLSVHTKTMYHLVIQARFDFQQKISEGNPLLFCPGAQ